MKRTATKLEAIRQYSLITEQDDVQLWRTHMKVILSYMASATACTG
jgi:hypothetical protein